MCPDAFEIFERCLVAGQHEMVAIVDPTAELGIEIGAAASPGLAGWPRAEYAGAALGSQARRRREPSEPGPDDVHGPVRGPELVAKP